MTTALRRPHRSATDSHDGLRLDLLVAGSAAGLVAAAALVGLWLLDRGVPLHVAAPPLLAQWLPHVGPGTVPAVLVAVLVTLWGPQLAGRLSWRPLLAASYLTALAWTLSLALVDGWQRGIAGRLTTGTEYLRDVPAVTDVPAMLATFTERILSFQPHTWSSPHVAGHPPGALLVFVGLDRVGLSGGAPAALLCVLIGASACVAVAVALRALGAEPLARAALPFGVLLPGAVWVGVSADGLFAGVLAWGVALVAVGAARPRLDGPATVAAVTGGLLLGASLYLSYGLALAALLPLAVLGCTRRPVPLLVAGGGVAAVVAAFTTAGFWWLDGYQKVTIRYYQPGEWGLDRPYSYWVWANLAALTVALGPATVAGLRRAAAGWHRPALRPLVLLCGAALLAVLLADLSGLSKAEVERIWLPFAVWLVAAAGLLPARHQRWWLAAQALVALAVNHLLLTGW
ncbi:MAG: hypothetical protein ACRDSP_16330 [Pseudonocardiaceae bacterium]